MHRVFSLLFTQLIFKFTFWDLSESVFNLLPDRIACHVIHHILVFWRSVRGIGLEFVMIFGAYKSKEKRDFRNGRMNRSILKTSHE